MNLFHGKRTVFVFLLALPVVEALVLYAGRGAGHIARGGSDHLYINHRLRSIGRFHLKGLPKTVDIHTTTDGDDISYEMCLYR